MFTPIFLNKWDPSRNGKHVFNCNDDVLYYEPKMASDMIFNEESTNNYSSTLVQLVCSMIQVKIFICV